MLVGVASLGPSSFPASGTQAFYSRKRQNCINICNTVYVISQNISLTFAFCCTKLKNNMHLRGGFKEMSQEGFFPAFFLRFSQDKGGKKFVKEHGCLALGHSQSFIPQAV